MSILTSLGRRGDSERRLSAPRKVAPGPYLTDGTRLYRAMGTVGGADGLVSLEDCANLDIWLLPANDLGRLRQVVPSENAIPQAL